MDSKQQAPRQVQNSPSVPNAQQWQQTINDVAVLKHLIASLQQENTTLKSQLAKSEQKIKDLSNKNDTQNTQKLKSAEIKSFDTKATKLYKPPPITVKGVKNMDKLKRILTQEEPVGEEQKFKLLSNEETKIFTTNEQQFRKTIKALEENQVQYYRHQLQSEKPFRVYLRGINHDVDLDLIKKELYDKGHEAVMMTNIQIRKKNDPKSKNGEWNYIKLPLFSVDLTPKENNKEIYNITELFYQKIKFEPPRKKKEVPQCKNCQAFGHTQNYCRRTAICVKCGEGHKTEECPKPKKSKANCANCGEGHTANWKGCSAYKKAVEKMYYYYVFRLFSGKPLYKLDYMVSYYPRHQETGHLMTRLRKYGLFRDEHQDFVDEMTRLRTLRGKVRRVGKKSTTLLTADTKS